MDGHTFNELVRSIEHWNEYRVPILRISLPDKSLNFQGAMRFYFQDAGQKVATKCVNVTSADTTKDVIDVLIEKFRPDMRMLSVPEYGLYEIHENGDERKLAPDEKPIFVQLEWNKDDREGRFLLRRMDEKTRDLATQNEEPSLKRKLSKKEKKKQEKLKKQQQKEEEKAASKLASKHKNGIAERLYNELPETSFTRSISNPEAVMKRRRAQKLEKRLQEFSLEGGQEAGGTLRIFGETLNKDVSYKTLLLSTKDTASFVVKQILEKYGKDDEDPNNYCLVQLVVPTSATSIGDNNSVNDFNASAALRESILEDHECPLLINQNHDKSKGILTFHIRHKPADHQKRRKKKPSTNGTRMEGNLPNQAQQFIPTVNANNQILPALIQVKEDVEDIFLSIVITHISPADTPFRLAPTYVLYMVSRYRASTLFHPELQAPSRAELFMPFTKKIATLIRNAIDAHIRDPTYLAFWLANSSDLSHFYKQDKHLSPFTIAAQEILYESIKASFKYLLSCKQLELDAVLHTFFDERYDGLNGHNGRTNQGPTAVDPILDVLNDTMATMRKNRVNAALTIQIFSHLFQHISKWLFDRLIGAKDNQPGLLGSQHNYAVYCNRVWGDKLNIRLAAITGWAEKQGLEQAADFHLARVSQVTRFLARRYPSQITPNDLKDACDCCDGLNPIQLRALLKRYQPEQPILHRIIENLLYMMDYSYMANDYPLEEDFELRIPFLIPEDGYSSELIRYIPNGLLDFVSYLSKIRVRNQELCIFTVQPTSSGHWTVYFKNHQPDAPEIIIIQLRKKNNSMGLSIIAAKGIGQERLGIYIKNVVKNGAAAMDGRLQAGDQLLEVDGNSLMDITQEQAAEIMMKTGPVVTLKIAKQAAIYHNVSDIINSVPTQTIVSPQPHVMIPPQPHVTISQQQHRQPEHSNHHHHHFQQQQQHHHAYPPPPPPQAFIPPAPAPLEPMQPVPPPIILQSPIKSPKKVSWVDTKPDRSLHTEIPLPLDSDPSDNNQPNGDGYSDDSIPTIHKQSNHYPDFQDEPLIGHNEDEDDSSSDDDNRDNNLTKNQDALTQPSTNGRDEAASNGQAYVVTESLTLEDIDEVLSSKTHNNWLEDSAGVIGTQEVYNDPRQRIVKERERPNAEVNIEKLSFQEKLKMFNISAQK